LAAVGGATVTLLDYSGADQVTTTDGSGNFTFTDLPKQAGVLTLRVEAAGCIPTVVEGFMSGDEVVLELIESTLTVTFANISNGVIATLYLEDTTTGVATAPVEFTLDGLTVDLYAVAGTYDLIVSTDDGGAAVIAGIDLTTDNTATVDGSVTGFYPDTFAGDDTTPATTTVAVTDNDSTTQTYTLSVPGDDTIATDTGTTTLVLDLSSVTTEETLILTDDGANRIVYATTYHPAAEVVAGAPATEATFSPEATFSVEAVGASGTVEVVIPAGGIDTSGISCGALPATIEVNTLTTASQYSSGSDLTEINLFMGDCMGGLYDMGTGNAARPLQRLIVSIPFDNGRILAGDFEDGFASINYAADRAAFEAGTGLTEVPTADLLSVDYVNGVATFQTNHLSVFGVGEPAPEAPAAGGGGGGGGGGCFIKSLVE
jgi:hypothetical protein